MTYSPPDRRRAEDPCSGTVGEDRVNDRAGRLRVLVDECGWVLATARSPGRPKGPEGRGEGAAARVGGVGRDEGRLGERGKAGVPPAGAVWGAR